MHARSGCRKSQMAKHSLQKDVWKEAGKRSRKESKRARKRGRKQGRKLQRFKEARSMEGSKAAMPAGSHTRK